MDARCCRRNSLGRNARCWGDGCAAAKLLRHLPNGRIVLVCADRQSNNVAAYQRTHDATNGRPLTSEVRGRAPGRAARRVPTRRSPAHRRCCCRRRTLAYWDLGKHAAEGLPLEHAGVGPQCGLSQSALTEKQIRSRITRSDCGLGAAIVDYTRAHNQRPKPFVRTETADEILASVTNL